MTNPITRYAVARENGFFKIEQEADIQRHRQRLINQGHIEDIAAGAFGPRRQQTLEQSAQTFEVLAEVLQQQARLDDPTAAARQEYERKVRGQLPALTEAEMQRYRSALYGVAAAVGHAPKLSLAGRHRYGALYAASGASPPTTVDTPTPQAREAARRAFTAGARSLLYGSALGIGGVVLLSSLALRAMDVRSPADFKLRAQEAANPLAHSLKSSLQPLKGRMQAAAASWFGLEVVQEGEGSGQVETEFTRSLSRRLHRRMGSHLSAQPEQPNSRE
ncbi:hypothetical protein COCSUDRAFT_65518 [Coccomyxa subellipsoidea C-169]|uniref:Uncharacterized protein n=1 Tax=Coccomyxa subellipsoidea (strain C-169) TaxID=574566 RepID=I0Z2C5_COCSC|nr:hypothetical protein COCSUDRAFT_65518 [Coccomyxa subellipsoidea C-169]EIE24794.1 hypothetical protein COCSUDRAFT_65518 [Coccomyxa subellipsoidea C-169]|eukprot:XP_005649338.1 hypothetical protein COCSUDRAFT_65518 [Coccomyxa subellipsoidea C-169]